MISAGYSTDQPSGSPAQGEPLFLVVGRLRRPHGVVGEMMMEVLTDFPERLGAGAVVFVGQEHRELRISRCRDADKALLVTFEQISDRETAGLLRNQLVYVRTDEIPTLPEGEYYHHQILGLSAIGDTGMRLGRVVEILETGANDIAVVRPESGRDVLIPLVDEFILKIDLQSGEIHVRLLAGLLPDAPPA
jgi:16S rRNA processing protein RimM